MAKAVGGKHGGRRPGAGRPIGSSHHARLTSQSLNTADAVIARRTIVEAILGTEHDPLLILVELAADTNKSDEIRVQAAGIAVKHVHPVLSQAQITTMHHGPEPGDIMRVLTDRLNRLAPPIDAVAEPSLEAPPATPEAAPDAADASQNASEPDLEPARKLAVVK